VRTARSAWIEAGLRALADGGPDAVRVEALAQTLGVSKGGFYWHFEGRSALLDELLDSWERTVVDRVIPQVEEAGDDARAQLRRLFALAAEVGDLLPTELAIRDWARRDAAVAARLRRVDTRRTQFMRGLFGAFCDADEAEVRALLAFSLFVGAPLIAAADTAAVVNRALDRLLA
jgi:AcrR family transcriptional regulator